MDYAVHGPICADNSRLKPCGHFSCTVTRIYVEAVEARRLELITRGGRSTGRSLYGAEQPGALSGAQCRALLKLSKRIKARDTP